MLWAALRPMLEPREARPGLPGSQCYELWVGTVCLRGGREGRTR